MKFHALAKTFEKKLADNSPGILTAIGIAGTLTTAYLSGKASFRAAEVLRDEQLKRSLKKTGQEDSPMAIDLEDKVKMVWKLYIPTAVSAFATTTAIVGANRISNRRAAAVAAAYTITEKAFSQYKDKVIEKIGATKEQEIRDAVAQDRVEQNPIGNKEVIITGGGETLFYDMYTGRYFDSTMENIKAAQNAVNHQVLNYFYASVNDYFDKVGLPRTKLGEEFGWNSDKLMELAFSTTMAEDGQRACITVDFVVAPIRDYYRVH